MQQIYSFSSSFINILQLLCPMTLYLIGIGLGNEQDISVRALEIVRKCDTVYLEHYTSILGVSPETLSAFYGREVELATRDIVEREAENKLLLPAKEKDVALLVVGDVFGATTHTDLFLRAKAFDVDCKVFFNASVMTTVGITGLELYKFGKTTSIVFPDGNWLPETPYDVVKQNQSQGLHTLCLLDIKVAEPSAEDIIRAERGEHVTPQPPRFMTVREGLEVLERIEEKRGEDVLKPDTLVIGVARLGHDDYTMRAGTVAELMDFDFGGPLHSLIIPGKLHHIEEEAINSLKTA